MNSAKKHFLREKYMEKRYSYYPIFSFTKSAVALRTYCSRNPNLFNVYRSVKRPKGEEYNNQDEDISTFFRCILSKLVTFREYPLWKRYPGCNTKLFLVVWL